MSYRVIENQLNKISAHSNRSEAIKAAKLMHQTHPDKYHEVYINHTGIFQLKPNDCIHGIPYGADCKHCNPYIGLKLLFWRYDLIYS